MSELNEKFIPESVPYHLVSEGTAGSRMFSKFKFGDAVVIDKGIVSGCVIGFAFYSHGSQVQVAWWNNGALVEQWVADWRIDLVEN